MRFLIFCILLFCYHVWVYAQNSADIPYLYSYEEHSKQFYAQFFLFEHIDSGEVHPEYGKKYYATTEKLYSHDGKVFVNER